MSMPRNKQYGDTRGKAPMSVVTELVAEEGTDAAAEERIVYRLCTLFPPPPGRGWINTDWMRARIRRIQGRPKK